MLAITKSFGLNGLDGYAVSVEIDLHHSLPGFSLVGLGDTAVKESHERVRSAIKNSCFSYPALKVVANLAPADVKKEGTHFDLPIAIGILSASEQLDYNTFQDTVMLGELSLDGSLRAVNGMLPLLISMAQQGVKKVVIPKENEAEASYVKGLEIYAWVLMTNHLHAIVSAGEKFPLGDIIRDFKKFTSKRILNELQTDLQESRRDWMLDRFHFSASNDKKMKDYRFWQDGYHPVLLTTGEFFTQKLDYIHANPVRQEFVARPEEYLYSSAVDFAGGRGVLPLSQI